MKENLLAELRSNIGFLRKAEQRIANVILSDPQVFVSLSIDGLSERADVSHGSIVNFSNKFAGGGFPVLKMWVASSLSDYEKPPFSTVEQSDGVKDVMKKNLNDYNAALKSTLSLNTEATLANVADRILRAKKVEIYGVYRSAVVATDFYYQLLMLGIPVSFVGDALSCAISASMLEADCLFVAVSSSGKTKDVLDAVRLAKANGVPVVALTSGKESPLAKLSDEVLVAASSGNTLSGGANEVRLSQLSLVDALCTYLMNRVGEDGEKRYLGLRSILELHNVND